MTAASAAFAIGSKLPLKIVTLGIFDEPNTHVTASPSLRHNANQRTPNSSVASKASENRSVEYPPPLAASAEAPSNPTHVIPEKKHPHVEQDVELRLQVAKYRNTLSLIQTDPVAALEAFRMHRRSWPISPIRQEVDYRIVQILATLGRQREAADAAKQFVKNYPTYAQASHLRSLYEISSSEETLEN
jgi:TolA-binding protein